MFRLRNELLWEGSHRGDGLPVTDEEQTEVVMLWEGQGALEMVCSAKSLVFSMFSSP